MKHVFVTACLLLTIVEWSLPAASSIVGKREAHVLILNGTDPYLPAYSDTDDAIRAILANQNADRIALFAETLDAQHLSEGKDCRPRTSALLAKKYEGLHIDVVVVFGRTALEFFKRQGERLWPDARVVYRDFTAEPVDRTELPPNAIGIVPHDDIAANYRYCAAYAARCTAYCCCLRCIGHYAKEQSSSARVTWGRPSRQASAFPVCRYQRAACLTAVEPADSIVIYLCAIS